jgi:hypothetical protein
VLSTTAPDAAALAHGELAAVLPAAHTPATAPYGPAAGRAIVVGWLSRGDGAPLELITTVGGQADEGAGSRARPARPAAGISPAEAAPLLASGVLADVPPAAGIARGKHAAPPRISVARCRSRCSSRPAPGACR